LIKFTGASSLVFSYLIYLVISIPIIFTYAERSSLIRGRDGAYQIAKARDFSSITFVTGWMLIAGYIALTALLAWGIALLLNTAFKLFFDTTFPEYWISIGIIVLVALNNLIERQTNWKVNGIFTFLSISFLVFLTIRGFLVPQPEVAAMSARSVTTQQTYSLASTTLMISTLWSLHYILNLRDQVKNPTKTVFPALLWTTFLSGTLGLLIAFLISNYSGNLSSSYYPLLSFSSVLEYVPSELIQLFFVIFGIGLNLLAINRSLVFGFNIIEQMAQDGFLPKRFQMRVTWGSGYLLTILVIAGFSALLIYFAPSIIIIGLTSITFLWTAAFVHLPDLFRPRTHFPEKRNPKLPFHPLFPGITIALGLLMPLTLGIKPLVIMGIWLAMGLGYYGLFARKTARAVRREETVLSKESIKEIRAKSSYRVMVSIANPERAPSLLKAGNKLAQARQGSLRVLKIVNALANTSNYRKDLLAHTEWNALSQWVTDELGTEHVAQPLIRMAPNTAVGIIETVSEEKIDLLILGWEGEIVPNEFYTDPVIGPILRDAPCEVAILRGNFPGVLQKLTVPTAGGPFAPVALSIAEDIVAPDGEISLTHFTKTYPTPEEEIQAQEYLQSSLEKAKNADQIHAEILASDDIQQSLVREAENSDLLLIGAAKSGGIFDTPYFGGLPIHVAHHSSKSSLVVRGLEKSHNLWLRRLWLMLTDRLPRLMPEERETVVQSMKLAAVPNTDFFILIILAAGIASLGLLQNSGAVIIGAMLVAPLMSPILAMAMSIVLGNLHMLRVAAEATFKGIALAILVGLVMVMISPIDAPTSEILGRTQPNVLDLLVALLSGMAAGYAVSRKQVAAALPGVAIAAALVPPLCVVGYGLGTSNLQIAFGALLLFTTNLITIILAATFVFLALGITPPRSERGELLRGVRITILLLAVVFTVLGFLTIQTLRDQRQENIIREIFFREAYSQSIRVTDLNIDHEDGNIVATVTLLNLQGGQLTTDQITELKSAVDRAIGENVVFRITSVPASFSETNLSSLEQESKLRDAFVIEVQQQPVQIISVEAVYLGYRDGYIINAEIYSIYPNTLTDSYLKRTQDRLSNLMGNTVSLNLKILQGEHIQLTPIPSPPP